MTRIVVVLVMVAVASLGAQNPPFVLPDSVELRQDIPYVLHDGASQRLDLFIPRAGNGPFPGVLFVACGGRAEGGVKAQFWRQAAHLATRGFVAVTAQCRPEPRKTQLNDALAALRWIRGRALEAKIDGARLAISGGSAGGRIAALIGTNRWNGSDWSGAPADARVQAVVALYFASDATTMPLWATSDDTQRALLRELSPMHHVGPETAPFLLIHGRDDKAVPFSQSVAMQRRLREVGVKAELFTADGADHGFAQWPPWYQPALMRMTEFLTGVLK